jgi:glucose/arabinose dehydrogenase
VPARSASLLALAFVAGALVFGLTASAATLPSGFQETVVLSGLTEPTAMRIAPDGSVFVIEKGGQVKVFDSLSDPTATVYADLRTQVHSYDDRGMLGLALDPNFPAVPDIYVSYAHDAAIGGTAPRWGTPGANSDPCPTPPGPSIDGCVISSRLSRLSPASGGGVPYRDAILADLPAGYWRLGETSGTTAADTSGNGRTGSYLNTPTLGQAGALTGDSNTSVGFDGTSEHVAVPYTAALNTPTTTLEAWVYPTGGQGRFRAVVSNRDYVVGSTRGSILYASASNTWQYWVGNGSGSWTVVGGPAVTLNDWTHVAGTYDGSTARLYVDGTLVASAPSAHTPNPSRPLRAAAGANEGAANYLLPGRVDEVAVYPTALSSTRVRAHYDAAAGSSGSGIVETVLIEDWCQQFTTGSSGGLAFGPDGELYMTAGAGGSYHFIDYGQRGQPPNPCGDPPGGVGATLSPPTSEGGWLRSQDLRTAGDPVGLGGTLIRVDRATGQGMPNNPLAGSSDPNARRIVAYGFRNPFRIAVRPGTRDVWIGDVGAGAFEEINRVPDPIASVRNFGWPCYEGTVRSSGFDAADLNICENLYAQSGAVTPPFFAFQHGQKVVPTETCSTTTGSAVSGFAFTPANSTFPASYDNALFFADYSRRCIWVMFADGSGIPNPATVTPFVQDASYPVDLQFGPDGNLYYVDVATGSIHRITYFAGNQPPVAVATGSPTSGAVPLTVNFNGSGSSDPDGSIASYAWDLDGDGQYDDSTAQNPPRTYTTAGTYVVRLRVTDNLGAPDVSDPITITAGSSAPTAVIDQPAPSFTWRAGDVIAFSGRGTDPEDGVIPASGLRWDVTLQHCTSPGNCHSHFVESFPGVASGSFSAPDHEYPSFLELKLTATDSSSISSSTTIALNPRTVTLTMQSVPSGLSLVVNNNPAQATPFTATVVEGSINTISAPSPQTPGATSYAFSSWSDGGGQTHTVTANSSATYTATYTPQGGGGPSYSSSVLADSPLAYWRLGESSGTTAADASGNGRTGSYLNTPTLGAGGALTSDSNTAVGFNGTDEYVTVPYAAALNPAQVTVEAWAYPTGGQGTFRSVVTSRDYAPGNARGYILYASSANTWQFWLGNGDWAVVFGPPIVLNQWTHLVGTYDGSTARLYVNGALAASAGASGFLQNTVRPLRIASGATDKTAPQYYLPGRVDEVAVYGSALSATRVQAHFAAAG